MVKVKPFYVSPDNNIVIYNNDCLDILPQIKDKSVDLVLTDPPYGENIGSMGFTTSLTGGIAKRTDYRNHDKDWDKEPLNEQEIKELFRVSKNQIIFGGNFYADKLPNSRCWICWDKITDDRYVCDFADCELIWTSFDKPSRIIRYLWRGMLQGNMTNKEQRVHPTQKPLPVILKLLKDYSNPNDLIIDCFLGSGTCAVACKQLNRRCIGIEISEKYCEIAVQRLKALPENMFK